MLPVVEEEKTTPQQTATQAQLPENSETEIPPRKSKDHFGDESAVAVQIGTRL
jgi:hypothetical protein